MDCPENDVARCCDLLQLRLNRTGRRSRLIDDRLRLDRRLHLTIDSHGKLTVSCFSAEVLGLNSFEFI